MKNAGFTLIELLIVIAISALMSALAITYSSVGRNEVTLSVEASKISQFILQAKELSIATYTNGAASCGYGVVLDAAAQTYSIFAYDPTGAPPCPNVSAITGISPSEEKEYTAGTWHIPVSQGVLLQTQGDSLVTVLFYPPEPTVFLSHDGSTFTSASNLDVHLATIDLQNKLTISVNPEGQVSL